MDMQSRNQYLLRVRDEYLKTKSKKEKGKLLDEAGKRAGLTRKYLIRKLKPKSNLDTRTEERKKRKEIYDGPVKTALIRVWEIFDYPCGQRLEPLVKQEVKRLMELGEVQISQEVVKKLLEISPASIDRKLAHERMVLHLSRNRHPKTRPLLYQRIPVKVLSEWDRNEVGNLQLDFVCHCGSSMAGDFINSLSVTDIASQWWEGEAIMGRGQERVKGALRCIEKRSPFALKEIHPDNDSAIINQLVFRWTQERGIAFSRSRPYQKNDNAYIEQKNWTHVRKVFGYLRYDTEKELEIINDLYHNELRLYKNFFQSVMKLKEKERISSTIRRKYDTPQPPYQRLMASDTIDPKTKEQLQALYNSLNPAELKRRIDAKLKLLLEVYQAKHHTQKVEHSKKLTPHLVTNYMSEPMPFRLPR